MRFICSLVMVIALAGCKNQPDFPENFDYGKTENGVYRNDYFKFELPVPADWKIQNKQQQEEIQKLGYELMEKGNEDLAKKIKASEVTSANLIMAFKYDQDDTVVVNFNPSILLQAQSVRNIRGVKDGEDVLEQVKSQLLSTNSGYKVDTEVTTEKIGPHTFYVMQAYNPYGGMVDVTQRFYATIDKGFALTAILSFEGKEQQKELLSIFNKLKFL